MDNAEEAQRLIAATRRIIENMERWRENETKPAKRGVWTRRINRRQEDINMMLLNIEVWKYMDELEARGE